MQFTRYIHLVLAVIVACLVMPKAALAGPDDLVVIIANKRYDNVHDVAYADRDGQAIADAAQRLLDVPRERIIVVSDASLARMRALFGTRDRPGEIAGRLAGRKAQRVWVYYSGHGVPVRRPSGQGFDAYLLPKDGLPDQPEFTAFPLDDVESALIRAREAHAPRAQFVLVLEACFSGRADTVEASSAVKGKDLVPESSKGGPVSIGTRPTQASLIVLAATQSDEIASWDREARHGLFTDLLLAGIFGGAARDGAVSVGGLEAFIAARMNERLAVLFPGHARTQRPEFRAGGTTVLLAARSEIRDQGMRDEERVLCSALAISPDPKSITDFLRSCRTCDEACRTKLDQRRRTIEATAAECAANDRAAERLVAAKQPKAVLEAALAGVPAHCSAARQRLAIAIAAIAEPPQAPLPPRPDPAIELRSWEKAEAEDTIAGWQSYLAAHPTGAHAAEAEKAVAARRANRLIRTFPGHKDGVTFAAFAPDGRAILANDKNSFTELFMLYDIKTGAKLRSFGTTKGINVGRGAPFSPDGQYILGHGKDDRLLWWDFQDPSKQWIHKVEGVEWVFGLAFSPDGKMFATANSDHSVRILDVASGKELQRFAQQGGRVWSVTWSPDGRWLLTGGENSHPRLLATGGPGFVIDNKVLEKAPKRRSWGVFSPDSKLAYTGGEDGEVRIWDVASGQLIKAFAPVQNAKSEGNGVIVSPDGRFLATGSSDHVLRFWHAHNPVTPILSLPPMQGDIWSMTFSTDGKRLLSAGKDEHIRLWDISDLAGLPTAPRVRGK